MGYICMKPIVLGGTEFRPGELIPDGTVLSTRVRTLKASGHIADAGDLSQNAPGANEESLPYDFSQDPADHVTVNLGEDPVDVTGEQLQSVINIMSKDAKEAAKAVSDEVDVNVLRIIRFIDSRKTVTEAVDKQQTIISSIMD